MMSAVDVRLEAVAYGPMFAIFSLVQHSHFIDEEVEVGRDNRDLPGVTHPEKK